MMRFPQTTLMAAILTASGLLSAAPVQPVIGSTAVFKIMKINAATNLTSPSSTTGCSPKIVTWGASSQCRGSAGALANGANVAVASSSGFSGSATFTCNASTDSLTLQPGSTCSTGAAAPSPCASQAVNWSVGGNTCNASASSASHSATVGVTDNSGPSTGSAQFACYSGTYTQVGSATCNMPSSCTITTGMGGVWGAGCQANYSTNESVPHGATRSLSDPGPFGYNGSATYVCNNGAMVYQSGTCANTPAPANCTSQSVSWSAAGTTCTGTAPATAHAGTTAPISASAPNTGQASFTCNNGSLSLVSGSSCLPPPAPAPANCAATTLTWTSGGLSCSGSVGSTSHNGVVSVNDATSPNTGSASYTCSNGAYTGPSGATCVAPAPAPAMASQEQVVAAGSRTSCAIQYGALKCWGYNANGQVGDGTQVDRSTPVQVVGMTSGVTAVSVGGNHTCAIQNGAAKCWGGNGSNPLGDGTTTSRLTPIQVQGLTSGVTKIVAIYNNTCVIHNGAMKCWGANAQGQIGDGTTTQRNLPTQVSGLTSGVTDIDRAYEHTCAVHNGAAKCWGRNDFGQIGDGTVTRRLLPTQVSGLTSGVTAISSNSYANCAVHSGAAKCWGGDSADSIPDLGNGTLNNSRTPVQVTGLTSGVQAISAGYSHTCAIHNGAPKCWGVNTTSQLGDGTQTNRSTPSSVINIDYYNKTGDTSVSEISAGGNHSCTVIDGGAYCWGSNLYGKIGTGAATSTQYSGPVDVSGMLNGVGE